MATGSIHQIVWVVGIVPSLCELCLGEATLTLSCSYHDFLCVYLTNCESPEETAVFQINEDYKPCNEALLHEL